MDYEISNAQTKMLAYGVTQQRTSIHEECSQRIKNQSALFANWRRTKMALKVTQIRSSIGSKPKQRVENKPQAQNNKSLNNTNNNPDAIIEDEENN